MEMVHRLYHVLSMLTGATTQITADQLLVMYFSCLVVKSHGVRRNKKLLRYQALKQNIWHSPLDS